MACKEAEAKIAELEMQIRRLENELVYKRMAHESLQELHFEQNERMTRELKQARNALKSVVEHCLPPTVTLSYVAQLSGAAPAWKEAAVVLYGVERDDAAIPAGQDARAKEGAE